MIRFTMPYPETAEGRKIWCREYSLNAIYAGKHYRARMKDKEYWVMLVHTCMRKAGITRRVASQPIRIICSWNDRLDLDNHAYIRKMLIDALKGWVIKDDTRKYIAEIVDKWHEKPYILIEITEAIHDSCN